jgi:hypothetical protein
MHLADLFFWKWVPRNTFPRITLDLVLFLQTSPHSVAHFFCPFMVPISCRPRKNNFCNCDRGNSNLTFKYLKCTWPIYFLGKWGPRNTFPRTTLDLLLFLQTNPHSVANIFLAHAWCQFHIGHVRTFFATATAEIPILDSNI